MKKITKNIKIKALLALPALVMLLFASCELKAQDTIWFDDGDYVVLEDEVILEEELINYADVLPVFPGGNDSLNAFIKQNLQYPKAAKEQSIEGVVVITFIVEKDGSVTFLRLDQSVNEEIDAEAKRLVSIMPKWKPGYNGPRFLRVPYTLPIVFKLDKE